LIAPHHSIVFSDKGEGVTGDYEGGDDVDGLSGEDDHVSGLRLGEGDLDTLAAVVAVGSAVRTIDAVER